MQLEQPAQENGDEQKVLPPVWQQLGRCLVSSRQMRGRDPGLGRPERCAMDALKRAIASLLPPKEERPATRSLEARLLELMASEAGLEPESTFPTSWAFVYPDDASLVRGMLSAGGLAVAAEALGVDAVSAEILESLAPYRTPSGGYRLENEFHTLVARA